MLSLAFQNNRSVDLKDIEFTVEQIRHWFHYEPETGELIWKNPRSKRCKPGQKVGSLSADGYLVVGLASRPRLVHRVIWYYVTGHWPEYPEEVIDHIDRNRLNNKWSNLRIGTVTENAQNRSTNKNSSTGCKGVSFDNKTGTYYVQKQRNNIRLVKRYIRTLEEACQIYTVL
uniref:HNH homing endonuclease n=1 Tax=Salmonella phage PMBT18 TaxID=3229742 RepID=A0AB39C091_9CAUD